jgi:hypothetical protein
MASDRDFKRLYLFKRLDGCCRQWYTEWNVDECVKNVIQGKYLTEPCAINRPGGGTPEDCNTTAPVVNNTELQLQMWYPDINGYRCKKDGNMASWMRAEGYAIWYLFNTREQCCAAFGFC